MELVAGWVFAALGFCTAVLLFAYISAFTLSKADSSRYTHCNIQSTRTLSVPAFAFKLSLSLSLSLSLVLISVANYHAQRYFIAVFVILHFMYSGYPSLEQKIIFKIWRRYKVQN